MPRPRPTEPTAYGCDACGMYWCPGRDKVLHTECPQTKPCDVLCGRSDCHDYGCQDAR